MGGGGGFDPISIIGNMIFGSVLGPLGQQATRASQTDTQDAEAALQAAEARRRADRKKEESALLAKARQAERATKTAQAAAVSLGGAAPATEESQLKARLGQ